MKILASKLSANLPVTIRLGLLEPIATDLASSATSSTGPGGWFGVGETVGFSHDGKDLVQKLVDVKGCCYTLWLLLDVIE